MGSTLFRDPQALGSALAALGTLQPRAFRSLNHVDPLDSVSNYYIDLHFLTTESDKHMCLLTRLYDIYIISSFRALANHLEYSFRPGNKHLLKTHNIWIKIGLDALKNYSVYTMIIPLMSIILVVTNLPVLWNPSCLQTTIASLVDHESSHTVPQALLL